MRRNNLCGNARKSNDCRGDEWRLYQISSSSKYFKIVQSLEALAKRMNSIL